MGTQQQLPSGRWRGVANHPTERDGNGRRKRDSETFDSLAEAEAWVSAKERDWDGAHATYGVSVSRQRQGSRHTLASSVEDYASRRVLSEDTAKVYRRTGRDICAVLGGERAVHAITKADVERYLRDLIHRDIGMREQIRRWDVLNGIFNLAVRNGHREGNPAAGLDKPKAPMARAHRLLDESEFWTIHDKLRPDMRPMALMALDTGMRWSEIAGLTIPRLHLAGGQVDVRAILAGRSPGRIAERTKGGAPRTLGLTPRLQDALRARIDTHGLGPEGAVFTDSRHGRLWNYRYFNEAWRAAVLAADVRAPLPRFHDLRHTCLTALARRPGALIMDVQRIAGHASITTTMIYAEANEVGRRVDWMRSVVDDLAEHSLSTDRGRAA